MPSGRIEDPVLAALDEEAAYLSRIAASVRLINALNEITWPLAILSPAERKRRKAIRQELRRVLAALASATEQRELLRAAYHEGKKEQ